jgi:hypothetical protein
MFRRTMSPSSPGCKKKPCKKPKWNQVASRAAYFSTLNVEETRSSETSVDFQRIKERYIPEDRTAHNHLFDNLKSYIKNFAFEFEVFDLTHLAQFMELWCSDLNTRDRHQGREMVCVRQSSLLVCSVNTSFVCLSGSAVTTARRAFGLRAEESEMDSGNGP